MWLVRELAVLASALGAELSAERFEIYARDLASDLTQEQLQQALIKARRESRFFPMISELREWAGADLNAESGGQILEMTVFIVLRRFPFISRDFPAGDGKPRPPSRKRR